MKKYLFIGLMILIGTNLAALGGVAYNRMADITAQLTLTERELILPYNYGAQKENSGMSLAINWRAPSLNTKNYYAYNAKEINITKNELLALGFTSNNLKDNYWAESRELYWAFEFDGELYQAALANANKNFQEALESFQEQENDANTREKNHREKALKKEQTTNSRLFFIEASADYDTLANKLATQQNVLIVKGLAKPYYNNSDQTYYLRLQHLSVRNIMVPLEYTNALSDLSRRDNRDIMAPRYAVEISWGSRLEPWITNAYKLEKDKN